VRTKENQDMSHISEAVHEEDRNNKLYKLKINQVLGTVYIVLQA
jgi:hypothetical protein